MKKQANRYFIFDTTQELGLRQRVFWIKNRMISMLYRFLYIFCKVNPVQKKYKVSVCAIFKNEATYLQEWIEFNRIIGIDHFYLYNNNSEDDYKSVLNEYVNEGLVTLEDWPQNQAQMECYAYCISQHKSETNWLGFIDIDEFIVPIEKNDIYSLLKPFERNRGAVKIYWKMFGTSGFLKRDVRNLVTEDFTVCWTKYYIVGKCFYNTTFDFNPKLPQNNTLHHSFWVTYHGLNLPPVNVYDQVCYKNSEYLRKSIHPIQINHYFTKSYSEYSAKRSKGDVYFKINPHDEDYFYLHECECITTDYSAYKYLIKLKRNLGKDEKL